jgi:tRNA threonylcarbamoyladenosine biosynthesis protein TsaB
MTAVPEPSKSEDGQAILALDAAGKSCSAALWVKDRIRARRFAVMERGQAEALIPMVSDVMADFAFEALDCLAVSRGPGGFTGVRIGLAAARGLALATGKPLVGLSSFRALAAGLSDEVQDCAGLLVCLEAKRREFFLQAYTPELEPVETARLITPAVLAEDLVATAAEKAWLLAGDAAPQAASALTQAGIAHGMAEQACHVDAAEMARLLGLGLAAPEAPEPLYLRGADVTLKTAPGAPVRRAVTSSGEASEA